MTNKEKDDLFEEITRNLNRLKDALCEENPAWSKVSIQVDTDSGESPLICARSASMPVWRVAVSNGWEGNTFCEAVEELKREIANAEER